MSAIDTYTLIMKTAKEYGLEPCFAVPLVRQEGAYFLYQDVFGAPFLAIAVQPAMSLRLYVQAALAEAASEILKRAIYARPLHTIYHEGAIYSFYSDRALVEVEEEKKELDRDEMIKTLIRLLWVSSFYPKLKALGYDHANPEDQMLLSEKIIVRGERVAPLYTAPETPK